MNEKKLLVNSYSLFLFIISVQLYMHVLFSNMISIYGNYATNVRKISVLFLNIS